jgi:hypothetical protein
MDVHVFKCCYINIFQVLDANKEYSEITELYEDKRQNILCGFV